MTGLSILIAYIIMFALAFMAVSYVERKRENRNFNSLKTVTFGDESAVKAHRAASVISVIVVFLIWGAFTGSVISPIHVPGPFVGNAEFEYTAKNKGGATDNAKVVLQVHMPDNKPEKINVPAGDGFAKDDVFQVRVWRSSLLKVEKNDEGGDDGDYQVTHINGKAMAPGMAMDVDGGKMIMTSKGSLSFESNPGLQMQPLYLPAPEAVVFRLIDIIENEYKNTSLLEHIGFSLMRVVVGFILGALVGIPLGYAMGLSGWFRGWFDPIVEFMRPVPPLALIPLVIIWFGIWETGKIVLLFFATLWIMIIAARSGVSGVNISKVHAAYSLGASKRQILFHVIIPNSLQEIFTGARVAMGVCWGTVVAAELVAAQKGVGMMIISASKFQQTDIVLLGIIIIGIIGYSIDVLMRKAENILIPWKGRS